jgi:hypothetical protein
MESLEATAFSLRKFTCGWIAFAEGSHSVVSGHWSQSDELLRILQGKPLELQALNSNP